MFIGKSKVYFTKTEGAEFAKALIWALGFATSKGYVRWLTMVFCFFVVDKMSLSTEHYNRTKETFRRIGLSFPTFRNASGLYYRPLHDNKFSQQERLEARQHWNANIDFHSINAVDFDWNNQITVILEKMRDAGVEPETIAGITRYLRNNGSRYIPDDYLAGPGQLRAVG